MGFPKYVMTKIWCDLFMKPARQPVGQYYRDVCVWNVFESQTLALLNSTTQNPANLTESQCSFWIQLKICTLLLWILKMKLIEIIHGHMHTLLEASTVLIPVCFTIIIGFCVRWWKHEKSIRIDSRTFALGILNIYSIIQHVLCACVRLLIFSLYCFGLGEFCAFGEF